MPRLLTVRKEKWANTVKPKVLRGLPLNYNVSASARYYDKLRKVILRMVAMTEKELEGFFEEPHAEEYFAQDASVSSQARILMNALAKKFDDLFDLKAKPISEDMADDADQSSEVALRGSLKQLSGGLTLKTDILTGELKDVLKASIAESTSLIKSIPDQYHKAVSGAVYRSLANGQGLADLVPFLEKYKGVTLRRAKNIALDQTKKAFSNINRVRMQKIGVKEYEWLHSHGSQHPRPYHVGYSGKIFSWDKPPLVQKGSTERAHPGIAINCSCRALPIIKFDED